LATVPVRFSATFVDEWGIEASAAYYAQADDTQTIAALAADAAAMTTLLDNVSDAYIKGTRITILPVVPTTIKTAAAAGSRVEETAILNFVPTQVSRRYGADVPAPKDTLMVADRLTISGGNAWVLLIAALTTGLTVLKWANEHQQELSKFVDALIGYHKKRKQLQRSSFEV